MIRFFLSINHSHNINKLEKNVKQPIIRAPDLVIKCKTDEENTPKNKNKK